MLDPRFLLALVLLEIWAWRAAHPLVSLAATLVLILALAVHWSWKWSLRGVEFRRRLQHERAHMGQSIELQLTLVNRKLLPLSALELEDTLPRHVEATGAVVRQTRDDLLPCLYVVRPMLPYESVTRRVRIRCRRRGVHQFGPARWHAFDFLGMLAQHAGSTDTHSLLVLPKVFPLALDARMPELLTGPLAARPRLWTDPLRIRGFREYRAGDPLRSVDWRATARRGSLIVREHEASSCPIVQIVLGFDVRAPSGDRVEPDELEFAISVAASLAAHALQQRFHVGLFGNALAQGAPIALPASGSPQQLARLLELLARAGSRPVGALHAVLEHKHRRHEPGAWLVIAEDLDARSCALLADARRRGRVVQVLLTGKSQAPAAVSLPLMRVPYEPGWSTRESLAII